MFSSLPFNYMFFVVVIFGTLFSISSSHWLGIWAGLEINLIGFLPLLVYQKSMSESESAVKYFVIQALGSSLLLFGSLGTYSLSFSWESLNSLEDFSYLSLLIISAGLILKMGIFPFHFWFPGVMAGLPWLSCLFLSTWQKVGPLFLMISLLEVNLMTWLLLTFCVVASGSSLLGGLGGMNQTQVRALLAYSSIGHLGWIMFAGIHSTWAMGLYFGIYVLISFCIFVSLWFMDLKFTKNLVGVLSLSYSALIVMIMLLSLGGLPPMLGFISKWAVIMVSVSQTLSIFIILLIVGSLMSLFYYLSLFFSLFLGALKEKSSKNLVLGNVAWMHSLGLLVNFLGGFLLLVSGVLWSV
uniref:NADH-ubiquinone oxidoreductase chain 2 n=1 Tax=Ifremeria nautilei TaxID=71812 RepID=A0A075DC75_IFRNA|nr:NADH dehydrogenase subunit 2 [Ifremeria nautilei]AHI45692.1 NADH dehydrogenase subunit 2 [Ifremeria nautilei]